MNFRQVKKKIKTIGNVKKITKAMQMVSAVKMKKAQKLALDGRKYREILEKIIKRSMKKLDHKYSQLLDNKNSEDKKIGKNLYILISTNKGLCGSFNFNLLSFLSKNSDLKNDDFVVIGKKAADFLARIKGNIKADFSTQVPFIDNVSAVFTMVLEKFFKKEYDGIYIVYNKFLTTSKSISTKSKILPFEYVVSEEDKEEEKEVTTEYLIEPSPEEIVDAVLKDLIKEKVKSAILDSEAAEHSARMLAMKNATDNATDIMYNLTLEGNKLRQNSITNELLDMISALESSAS